MRSAAAPLRIYWLTSEFFPPETGGTGMLAARLTQGLAARGIDVRVATRQTQPVCPPDERVGAVRVRRLGAGGRMKGAGWRALPAMLGFIAGLARLLIRERGHYDLVVVSGMKTIPLAAVPVCRLLRKGCVVRLESPFELVEPISAESLHMMHGVIGRSLSRILKALQVAVLRRADRVVAISADIAARLASFDVPAARIARIPNAVDLSRFEPASPTLRHALRERFGFAPGRVIVLYVGRLSRAKGIMTLVEIWPRLVAQYPNIQLVMVGSGKDSWDDCEPDILEYVRKQALESSVTLAGHSTDVHEYLQASDLFVSPSDYEGFSLTLVEALGCALPVVTTAVGAVPEIIRHGENGFVCAPKSAPELQAALAEALDRRADWPGIGKRARESAEAFGVPQVVESYLDLLNNLSAERT
jgi:glycosyltransferase involved in cell wall biosynthesis